MERRCQKSRAERVLTRVLELSTCGRMRDTRMRRIWPLRAKEAGEARSRAPEVQVEDDEQRYKPIEWPLVKRVLRNLWPYKGLYGLAAGLGVLMLVLDMQSPRF